MLMRREDLEKLALTSVSEGCWQGRAVIVHGWVW
jgi:hypothetical protein